MSTLQKHLKECRSCTAPPFYVLADAGYEESPNFCPFCGSEEIQDYVVKSAPVEEEDDT